MTDFGSRHKASHQDGGGDEIDVTGLVGRVDYVDRGDPAAYDWEVEDLTTDGTWYDLDCSTVVPSGAKAIVLSIVCVDDVSGGWIYLRKNGNVNLHNSGIVYQSVANLSASGFFIIPCDDNRIIEYKARAKEWTDLNITIAGWLI